MTASDGEKEIAAKFFEWTSIITDVKYRFFSKNGSTLLNVRYETYHEGEVLLQFEASSPLECVCQLLIEVGMIDA